LVQAALPLLRSSCALTALTALTPIRVLFYLLLRFYFFFFTQKKQISKSPSAASVVSVSLRELVCQLTCEK
jgi:hypothetical protein